MGHGPPAAAAQQQRLLLLYVISASVCISRFKAALLPCLSALFALIMHASDQQVANQLLLHMLCSLGCTAVYAAAACIVQAISCCNSAHILRLGNLHRLPALSRTCWNILWMLVVGWFD
jgi:hypothetical protein